MLDEVSGLYERDEYRAGMESEFERITVDPSKMRGAPCIRGLRIPVATVLGQLAAGVPSEQILLDFPDLEPPTWLTKTLDHLDVSTMDIEG